MYAFNLLQNDDDGGGLISIENGYQFYLVPMEGDNIKLMYNEPE